MPPSLKTLENRRYGCIKKIEELKATAFGIGGVNLGNLQFNSSGFFTGLVNMSKEDINAFLSLFPQLPRVLEIARQAANEESIRFLTFLFNSLMYLNFFNITWWIYNLV